MPVDREIGKKWCLVIPASYCRLKKVGGCGQTIAGGLTQLTGGGIGEVWSEGGRTPSPEPARDSFIMMIIGSQGYLTRGDWLRKTHGGGGGGRGMCIESRDTVTQKISMSRLLHGSMKETPFYSFARSRHTELSCLVVQLKVMCAIPFHAGTSRRPNHREYPQIITFAVHARE